MAYCVEEVPPRLAASVSCGIRELLRTHNDSASVILTELVIHPLNISMTSRSKKSHAYEFSWLDVLLCLWDFL